MTFAIQGLLSLLFLTSFSYATSNGHAENQIEICEGDLSKVRHVLGMHSIPSKERYTGFFDTKSLDLLQRDFYVRVRRTAKKIKIAFKKNNPSSEVWNHPQTDCETDVHIDYSKTSCTYETDLSISEFEALKAHPEKWQKIFSSEAVEMYQLLSNDFRDFSRLQYLGEVLGYKWEVKGAQGPVVLDAWLMPPQQIPMMEVSVRSPVSESRKIFSEVFHDLQKRGLKLCNNTQDRTKSLLRYLSQQHP